MGDEDDSPSIIVAEVYVEGNDIVLRVTPEWECRERLLGGGRAMIPGQR